MSELPHAHWIRRLSVLTVIGSLVALAVLLGPRPWPRTELAEPALPDDLATWLADREQGVRDGVEARLVRVADRTPLAVVVLHGFSATRRETAPLAERVAERLGANLYEARLTGHGRDGAALGGATAHDWLQDAYEAVRVGQRLGDRVVLLGSSTGATLALAVLGLEPELQEPLAALVLLSPNFRPADPRARMLAWPWSRTWVPWIAGRDRRFEPANDAQARYWTTRYPIDALFEMTAVTTLVGRQDLARVTVPTLVAYCPADRIVDPRAIERRFDELGAERRRLLAIPETDDPGNHVLAGDALAPSTTVRLVDAIVAFVQPR